MQCDHVIPQTTRQQRTHSLSIILVYLHPQCPTGRRKEVEKQTGFPRISAILRMSYVIYEVSLIWCSAKEC